MADEDIVAVPSDPPSKKKAKKRPSDFEIARTLLQRSHERKLPYLLKDTGEDHDLLVLCSVDESGFTYGSADISFLLIEITDPSLQDAMNSILTKVKGYTHVNQYQRLINIRDQISELAKTKGESLPDDVETNVAGSAWITRTDVQGKQRIVPYCQVIDSLFHVQCVGAWSKQYRFLLETEDPAHLYYPYTHGNSRTSTIVNFPKDKYDNHPVMAYYPSGFRILLTRGIDVLIDKGLTEFPYPVVTQEIIFFQDNASACQYAHRMTGDGWRMVLVRPNAVVFPHIDTPLPPLGHHSL